MFFNRTARIGALATSLLAGDAHAVMPEQNLCAPTQGFSSQQFDPNVRDTLVKEPVVSVPRGTSRIELSESGAKWIDTQKTLGRNTLERDAYPRLINASTFLSDSTKKNLERFVGFIDEESDIEFKTTSEGGYQFCFVVGSGETWYLSESPFYLDQFPTGIPFSEDSFEIWKKGSDGHIQKEFRASSIFGYNLEGKLSINFDNLKDLMTRANADGDCERKDFARTREICLSSQPTGYIALVDTNAKDPFTAATCSDARHFPQLMNSLKDMDGNCLHNFVSRDGSDYIDVKSDPEKLINRYVKEFYDLGVRDFFINLSGHGNAVGIYFSSQSKEKEYLNAPQLQKLFTNYPDCNICVNACGCSGGGIAYEMSNYIDPAGIKGRIKIVLQSKIDGDSQEGRIQLNKDNQLMPPSHSTYFQVFQAYYLSKGLNFGEACYRADGQAKRLGTSDAEVWISGGPGERMQCTK
jgi:hypothetical protein